MYAIAAENMSREMRTYRRSDKDGYEGTSE